MRCLPTFRGSVDIKIILEFRVVIIRLLKSGLCLVGVLVDTSSPSTAPTTATVLLRWLLLLFIVVQINNGRSFSFRTGGSTYACITSLVGLPPDAFPIEVLCGCTARRASSSYE